MSIGTETVGSLIMPADRAALYTIKPTHGIISREGIVPISKLCDTAGPMTKCARDVAVLMDVLVDGRKAEVPQGGYVGAFEEGWEGLRVGVLEPGDWFYEDKGLRDKKVVREQMVSHKPELESALTVERRERSKPHTKPSPPT